MGCYKMTHFIFVNILQNKNLNPEILYLNGIKIDFCYKYKFTKEGKYTFKIIFKKPLININYMFYDCNKLFSLFYLPLCSS